MRIKNVSLYTLICVMSLIMLSCKRNYVELDYTNAKGEVPQLGNLVFRFNKALYQDSPQLLVSSFL